jgi:hypothetical protein
LAVPGPLPSGAAIAIGGRYLLASAKNAGAAVATLDARLAGAAGTQGVDVVPLG